MSNVWRGRREKLKQDMRKLLKGLNSFMSCMWEWFHKCVCVCVCAQSCPTLCNPMDCNPPGSSVHGDSPGQNTGMGCHDLFQGIFPTQGSNSGLPHCRQILYQLRHQGSPLPHPHPKSLKRQKGQLLKSASPDQQQQTRAEAKMTKIYRDRLGV